jgi:hypothetical protein
MVQGTNPELADRLTIKLVEQYGSGLVWAIFYYGLVNILSKTSPSTSFSSAFPGPEHLYLETFTFSERHEYDVIHFQITYDRLEKLPKFLLSQGFIEEAMKAQEYLTWCQTHIPSWPSSSNRTAGSAC